MVFFKKTESELGDGDWTVGMIEQVIPSKDGLIRKVVVKYRNSRKLIKLFNVDDEDLSNDLEWVQKQLEKLHEEVFPDPAPKVAQVAGTDTVSDVQEIKSKCKSCCCLEHCMVRFHNLTGKSMVNTTMSDMKFGFEDMITGWLGEPVPDIEATASNMFQEESVNVGHVLKNVAFNL